MASTTSYMLLPIFILLVSLASSSVASTNLDPAKVEVMMKAFAPLVYFHPDEEYFPSSVTWFFQNGAWLNQVGRDPTHVINNGVNLPTIGGADDSSLDLPSGPDRDMVKKGSLSDAHGYVHAKTSLDGTCTDLAIWLYYPFNGGGRFQLGPFAVSLGKIGEHVSDWEHITLRIDNASGELKAVYLSQHSKGVWLGPEEFEFVDGRPVVYASLHGHAHYPKPASHVHLAGNLDRRDVMMLYENLDMMNTNNNDISISQSKIHLGFGIVDDAAKSNNVMDLASAFRIFNIDDVDVGFAPWQNYTGRWGPKINYQLPEDLINSVAGSLPRFFRRLAIKCLKKVAPELVGQEGPVGPKMKDSWSSEERAMMMSTIDQESWSQGNNRPFDDYYNN